VLPPVCPGCAEELRRGVWICADCRRRVRRVGSPVCFTCRREGGGEREAGLGCSNPGHLQGRSAFWMEPPLDAVVHDLKYRDQPQLATALGALLAREVPLPPGAVVTSLPLHRVRQRERGYNQAARIAEAAARRWGVAPPEPALTRHRATRAQARLAAGHRAANVAGAFRCLDPDRVRSRIWVLVDDVVTTGSTLSEASTCLLEAGATWVMPVTLALA